jgi:hypothetical protein
MVELKGAKVELDCKMPTRNITPVQQVWNYLNASESAQWAKGLRGVKPCSAAHNAVGLAGESPVVGIDCLPT